MNFLLSALLLIQPPSIVTDGAPPPDTPAPVVVAPTGPVETQINWNTFLPLLVAQILVLATGLAGLWKSITQGTAINQLQKQQGLNAIEITKSKEISMQNQNLLHEAKQDVVEAKTKAAETKQIVEGIAKNTGTGGVPPVV